MVTHSRQTLYYTSTTRRNIISEFSPGITARKEGEPVSRAKEFWAFETIELKLGLWGWRSFGAGTANVPCPKKIPIKWAQKKTNAQNRIAGVVWGKKPLGTQGRMNDYIHFVPSGSWRHEHMDLGGKATKAGEPL